MHEIQHIQLFNKFLYCVRKHEVSLSILNRRYKEYDIFFKIKLKTINDVFLFYFDKSRFHFKLHSNKSYSKEGLIYKIISAIKFPIYCYVAYKEWIKIFSILNYLTNFYTVLGNTK